MTHPPAPAPLPPEEIRRVGRRDRIRTLVRKIRDRQSSVSFVRHTDECCVFVEQAFEEERAALLAEIKAGRAGVERVTALENALRIVGASDKVPASIRHVANRAVAGDESIALVGDAAAAAFDAAMPDTIPDAALRQPAQPADGAEYEGSILHRAHLAEAQIKAADEALDRAGVPRDDHSTEGELSLSARIDLLQNYREDEASDAEDEIDRLTQAHTPAAPAQVGAQPAGRVERDLLRAAMSRSLYTPGSSAWKIADKVISDAATKLVEAELRATPPTAGAGDGQENGNG